MDDHIKDSDRGPVEEPVKEPYSLPVVTCYGSVGELTLTGSGDFTDTAGEGSGLL
jgi:hypothetical protein